MTEPRDWPFERPATGTLRPWFLSAMGYLAVLFSDGVEAERTRNGLVESGVPNADLRLYPSSRTLEILAHQREERSAVARAVEALAADPAAKKTGTREMGDAIAAGV